MLIFQIQRWAKETPDNIAYICEQGALTYRLLFQRARQLATFIQRVNQDKAPVILFGHKQVLMPVCIVACMIAGVPYVPVDDSTPQERLQKIIDESGAQLVFAISNCEAARCTVISRSDLDYYSTKEKPLGCKSWKEEATCYILFTSGSTGTPKGIKISNANLRHYLEWMDGAVRKRKSGYKIILNQANFSFDLSVADLYYALYTGAAVYVLEQAIQRDYERFIERLRNSDAQLAVMTPSFAMYCLLDGSFCAALLPHLECIFFCGETLRPKVVQKLWERFPSLRVINAYGPTETTVAVCAAEITKSMLQHDVLPIATQHSCVRLVDNDMRDVPDGTTGEILITGNGVGQGYINSDNAPFVCVDGLRAYLSGDMGVRKEGSLYCLGRNDQQVKRSGYRIDLCDIESNMNRLDVVADSAVVATDVGGQARITAFVQPSAGVTVEQHQLLSDLKRKIPVYLLPDRIVVLDTLPHTPNRKIDKTALKRMIGA